MKKSVIFAKKPCFGENTEKYKTIAVLIEKEVTRIDKMEKKLRKIYLTYYKLLIAQDYG